MGGGNLTPEELRLERLRREREWYLSEDGFLDFVRDSGCAPDAQFKPHGENAHRIIHWNGEVDPESWKTIYKFKMVLWPRGSFKSTVFDIGYACWRIAKDPDIRILVCSETGKQGRALAKKIMDIVDSHWFKERFGVHKGAQWSMAQGFISALRTKTHMREPTMVGTGVGEVRTGMHWDLVLMDDVCSQENTKTPESIESLWFWFGETLAQLDPGCQLMVIGTLHHYADIYCKIQKDPEMRKRFEISTHSWRNVDGTLFFPGRLTTQFVENQKAFMPPRLFACFYENRPMTGEQQLFKPEYFKVIEDEHIPLAVWTYIFTDFAFIAEEKKKGRADTTCFWVVSLDCNRVAYVRDFYVGRWKPSDSVRLVCSLWDKYNPLHIKGIVLEDTTHKELLQSVFEEVRRETFVRPKLIPIGGRSQEIKDYRIEAIEPRFRRGDIYFARTLREQWDKWRALINGMTEWPFSAHDDIPDAISDLDKQDKDGKIYCPGPPVGWRPSQAFRQRMPMVNGRLNPSYGYPARESVRQHQQTGGQDLWQRNSSSTADPLGKDSSFWTKRPPSLGMPGKS